MKCKEYGKDVSRKPLRERLEEARKIKDKKTQTSPWFLFFCFLVLILGIGAPVSYGVIGAWLGFYPMSIIATTDEIPLASQIASALAVVLLFCFEMLQKTRKIREFPKKFPKEAEILLMG